MDAPDSPPEAARAQAFDRIEEILDDVINRGRAPGRLAHARALISWLRANLATDRADPER